MTGLRHAPLALVLTALACDANLSGHRTARGTGDVVGAAAARGRPDAEIARVCGVGDGVGLHRRPYLQQVTDRSALLLWTSPAAAPGEALFWNGQGPVRRAAAWWDSSVRPPHGARQHQARLDRLQPGTITCYRIGHGARIAAWGGFRTAPPPGSPEMLRFAVIGDSGGGGADQQAVLQQLRAHRFDLMLHTGDLAYDDGTRAQIEARFFAIYAPLLRSLPAFPVLGNHEYRTESGAPFLEAFALPDNGGPQGRERWYSFDRGQVHFVALDTEQVGVAQAAWLDADLSGNRLPWVVAYLHKPPFSSGARGGDAAVARTLTPILERHAVPLVLAGHEHHYERTRPMRGVTYVITGGGGRGVRPMGRSAFTAFGEAVLHFVHVTVEPQRLTLQAIDATGRTFDGLALHAAPVLQPGDTRLTSTDR